MRKLREHFSGSRRVLVHQNCDPAVKRAAAKPFGHERDGSLPSEFQGEGQKLEFEARDVTEARELVAIIAMLSHGSAEAETDWDLVGRQVAHYAQASEAAPRVSPEVDQ